MCEACLACRPCNVSSVHCFCRSCKPVSESLARQHSSKRLCVLSTLGKTKGLNWTNLRTWPTLCSESS